MPQDTDGNVSNTNVTLQTENGYSVLAALGYDTGTGLRIEIEGGYSKTELDRVNIGGTIITLNGDVDIWSVFGAAYYDFNLGAFKPYVGAGVGMVHQDISNLSATARGITVNGSNVNDTSLSAFGEVGVGFALNERLTLAPGVRYLWIDDGSGGVDDTTAFLFRLGLRYNF